MDQEGGAVGYSTVLRHPPLLAPFGVLSRRKSQVETRNLVAVPTDDWSDEKRTLIAATQEQVEFEAKATGAPISFPDAAAICTIQSYYHFPDIDDDERAALCVDAITTIFDAVKLARTDAAGHG